MVASSDIRIDADCGCYVTFYARSGYKSRLLTACRKHTYLPAHSKECEAAARFNEIDRIILVAKHELLRRIGNHAG